MAGQASTSKKITYSILENAFCPNGNFRAYFSGLISFSVYVCASGKNKTRVANDDEVEEFRNQHTEEVISFVVVFKFNLISNSEARWAGFVRVNHKAASDRKSEINSFKESVLIDLVFSVDEIKFKDIHYLQEILNIRTENDSLEIRRHMNIKKCIFGDVQVVGNNREGYIQVWAWLKGLYVEEFSGVISVKLSDENDVTNLRYFLPLWHYFKKTDNIVLKILADNDEIGYKAQQCLLKSGINFRVIKDGTQINPRKNDTASAILPMIYFYKEDNADNSEICLELIDVTLNYFKNINNYKGREGEFQIPSKPDEEKGIFSKEQIKDKLLEIIDVLTKQSNRFEKLIFLFIVRYLLDEKKIFVCEKATETDKVVKFDLDYGLLEIAWINAKSYAEGLWQLIENAQKHSGGRTAFFGMRIYKANPKETMGTVAEEAQTRKMLWRKYWAKQIRNGKKNRCEDAKMEVRDKQCRNFNTFDGNNIFNIGHDKERGVVYPDFIEFYVLDDAIDGNGEASGIVNKINTQDIFTNKISSMEQIFGLTEDDYKDEKNNKYNLPNKLLYYIQHYGMRWFKSHIDKLNGIMEIYSPYQPENGEDKFGKACCYSNVFINLEQAAPYYKFLFSTEYSILVPLEY